MDLTAVILAAGKGKRMVSDLPKVLHPLGGRPLLSHVLATAGGLGASEIRVVYGHGGELVRTACSPGSDVIWVEQGEQLGTGHAVAQTLSSAGDGGLMLVLYGDVPLVRRDTLQALVDSAGKGCLALLTVELPDPTGYGRVIRNADGKVRQVVEQADATPEQARVREVNTGILAAPVSCLRRWVQALDNDNAQGEYYLTDVIEMAAHDGVGIEAFSAPDPREVQGVNDRRQLAELERYYQRLQTDALMLGGATLRDPARVDVRGPLSVGKDVVIDVNVIFEGEVRLGDRVRIGPNTVIRDTRIEDDTEVMANCHLEGVEVGKQVTIGPYARLRPGAVVADRAKVGNFVEVKKTLIGEGSKVNHLTYLGDTEIGRDVNIGAGTITCNYDGANKHKTTIEDRAFIGSNVSLVAPVRIGEGATVGAGSTIGKSVPAGNLALTRASQKLKEDWPRPVKRGS